MTDVWSAKEHPKALAALPSHAVKTWALIAAVLAVTTGLTDGTSSQSSEQAEASAWFWQVRTQAHDAILPLALPGQLVGYRSSDDMRTDGRERYFGIEYVRAGVGFAPNLLKATVLSPAADSIHNQLVALRMKDRTASLTDLVSRLVLKKATVYADSCSPLLTQVDRLRQVRVTIPRRDVIVIHPEIHEFMINLPSLQMTATIEGNGDPLVDWATRTHELLMQCLPAQ